MTKRLGILGGMGPAASAEYVVRLIQQTPATCDQEHIPFVLWSDPTVPDRSTSLLNKDDKPLPYLLAGIKGLFSAGCNLIVIPCNTAHFWYSELVRQNPRVTIIHIVDSVADALRDVNVTNSTVGLMGTQATIELGLYQYKLNKQGWDCIVPTKEEMDTLVQPAIDLVKAGDMIKSHAMLMSVVDSLITRGATAVVLGCTEIPLAVRESQQGNIPLINSIDSLVKSAIKQFKRS
jgi:aspartate racemase